MHKLTLEVTMKVPHKTLCTCLSGIFYTCERGRDSRQEFSLFSPSHTAGGRTPGQQVQAHQYQSIMSLKIGRRGGQAGEGWAGSGAVEGASGEEGVITSEKTQLGPMAESLWVA